MKIKNIEIIQMLNALNGMATIELPVRLAYGIQKNNKKLMSEYADYEGQYNILKEKYNGDDKSEEYGKEIRELLDIEVDIEFYKVGEEIFESSDFSITPQQLYALDFMIEQKERKEEEVK